MSLNKENVFKLISALHSENYTQIKKHLAKNNCYCVLGVAALVYKLESWVFEG